MPPGNKTRLIRLTINKGLHQTTEGDRAMRADPIQRAIDEDLVRVLYAQDPIAFFSHWFSIAVLVAIYWPKIPSPPLFIACFGFYAAANCAGLALWVCNRRYPKLV